MWVLSLNNPCALETALHGAELVALLLQKTEILGQGSLFGLLHDATSLMQRWTTILTLVLDH
jgi:hypothetical protein